MCQYQNRIENENHVPFILIPKSIEYEISFLSIFILLIIEVI